MINNTYNILNFLCHLNRVLDWLIKVQVNEIDGHDRVLVGEMKE